MPNDNIWGDLYNIPQNQLHALDPTTTAEEVVWIDSFLDKYREDSVLDLGAGFGRHVRGLRDLGYKKLVAVENDPAAVEALRKQGVFVAVADFRTTSLGYKEAAAYSWFGTFSSGTQEQNEQAFENAHRIIRPGGLLIVQQANFETLSKIYAKPIATTVPLPDGSEVIDGGYILPTGEFRGVRAHNGLSAAYSIFYYPTDVLVGMFEESGFVVTCVETNETDVRVVGVRDGT